MVELIKIDANEQVTLFKEFFELYYKDKISTLKGDTFLVVDFNHLSKFDLDLSFALLENAEETIMAAEIAIKQFEEIEEPNFKIRFNNLLPSDKCLIGDVRAKLIGKLMWFEGYLLRKSKVLPRTTVAKFECPACGNIIKVLQLNETFGEPSKCGCGRKGKCDMISKELIDVQSLVIQEKQDELEGTEQPQTIHVLLKEDLVAPHKARKFNPGSNVKIIGIPKEVPIILRTGGISTSFDIVIEANNIEMIGESFEDIDLSKEDKQEIIKASKSNPIKLMAEAIAPTIYGHKKLKEAIVLQLFGGVKKTLEDGRDVRGDSHLLIIGDPGAGKTALLRFLTKLAPKWQYISGGGGTSGRGISASVVKDEILKTWTLDAGAAVLANDGMLFFDELDKMVKEDRWAIHEVMESQSFTIHKAGINQTLMARCTILAAANPKFGRFDTNSTISEQIELEPTLINRFDLIFTVKDIPNEEEDAKLSRHILLSHRKKLKLAETTSGNPFMDRTFYKKYISYAKTQIFPELTDEAVEVIHNYYVNLRKQGMVEEGKSMPIPINARYEEGIIRLCESCAKVRLSQKTSKEDAEKAVGLVDFCLKQFGFDEETGMIDIDQIAGISASKRDKYNLIKKIVIGFKDQMNNVIPIDDIIDKAKEEGIEIEESEKLIDSLKVNGDLYEPRRGFIGVVF